MSVTVTAANSVPAGSLGAAYSNLTITGALTAAGLIKFTGTEDGVTAHGGGTQAAAFALSATKNFHRIATCATANDSVKLPAATAGQAHFIRNDGVASAQIFGTGSDTIDGAAAATGVALPSGLGEWYICLTDGLWQTTDGAFTGSGANVLATSPTLVTPNLGTPSAVVLTNATGTAAGLTAGTARQLASNISGAKGSSLAGSATWNTFYTMPFNTSALVVVAPNGVYHGKWIGLVHFFDSADKAVVELLDTGQITGTVTVGNGGELSYRNDSANTADNVQYIVTFF